MRELSQALSPKWLLLKDEIAKNPQSVNEGVDFSPKTSHK
ncbi:hypothetical protein RHECNPAF_94008 [Rhizobium etli CNPAF512]|nr:hypothetical protein RHECNPAF_94008 [Rhizobium etli CNPAF512]